MKPLSNFDPELRVWHPDGRGQGGGVLRRVANLTEAQGVEFDCPCGEGHRVMVWFKNPSVLPVAGDDAPGPSPRWEHSGTDIKSLTIAPSINVRGCWHGFVRQGQVTGA